MHPLSIGEAHSALWSRDRIAQIGDIKQLHPVSIGHPQIAELDRARPRIIQLAHSGNLWVHRIGEIDDAA